MTMFICPPPSPKTLPLTAVLAVGFGVVTVTKDNTQVWSGDDEHVWLRRFEHRAAKDPKHDWRVIFHGPLSDSTYQRRAEGWVLIDRGPGFA